MKKVVLLLLLVGTTVGALWAASVPDLIVRFGYEGTPYTLHMLDNDTAMAIARYVGNQSWNLPVYGFKDSDVYQYYDIPRKYKIPSTPVTVTAEKAGEVYYSAPNRLVLFYHDAEVSGQFTKIGNFDATKEFITAVEENPVLEGWGNKIIKVSR